MFRRSAILAAAALGALAALVPAGLVDASSLTGRGRAPARLAAPAATDALDPLTADEIRTTFTVIEQSRPLARGTFFPLVKLDEPAKAGSGWTLRKPLARRAFANVFDRDANALYEAVVDLKAKKLVSWTRRQGEQPAVYLSEYAAADEIVHAYGPFQQAMRARGLDPADVYVDVWAPGDRPSSAAPGTRLL